MAASSNMLTTLGALLLSFSFLLLRRQAEAATSVPAIYLFGDSLMDVGAMVPSPYGIDSPKAGPDGRWGNGRNVADSLARKLGFESSPPSFRSFNDSAKDKTDAYLGGLNFAAGGAGVQDWVNKGTTMAPLSLQLEQWNGVYEALERRLGAEAAGEHLSRCLVVFNIGTNDILNFPNVTVKSYTALMVSLLEKHFQGLYEQGFRKFVFIGMEVVGCFPFVTSNGDASCLQELNKLSVHYNNAVAAALQTLKDKSGGSDATMNYSFFNSYRVFINFIRHPAAHGFKDAWHGCRMMFNSTSYCNNRDEYVFFDPLHQTQRTADLLMDVAFNGSSRDVYPMNVAQLVGKLY